MRTRGVAALLVVGLVAYGAIAVAAYRARSRPVTEALAASNPLVPPDRLAAEAERRIERARHALQSDRPIEERFRGYRHELTEARDLLVRAVGIAPRSGARMLRLAAIESELSRIGQATSATPAEALATLGATLAPLDPAVQFATADWMLSAGYADRGVEFAHAALVLEPDLAADVAKLLERRGWSALESLDALPRSREVLVALAPGLGREDRLESFLDAVESFSASPDASLLRTYGDRGREAGHSERVARHLEALAAPDDPSADVERWIQLAASRLAGGDRAAALSAARRASEVLPGDTRAALYLGRVAAANGELDLAMAAFRDALARAARAGRPDSERAALYGWIGWTAERLGHDDRAAENYRRAGALDPQEPHSRRYRESGLE